MAGVGSTIFVLATIMVIFQLAGVGVVSAIIVDYLTNFTNIKVSNFFETITDTLITLGVVAGAAAIIIGTISPQRSQFLLLIGYSVILFGFTADIYVIWQTLSAGGGWIKSLASIIFIPLGVLYIHLVTSWWGQRSE